MFSFYIQHNYWFNLSDKKPPKEWPDKGQIEFNKLSLRYKTDTPFVLKNLNIEIKPMEKVI